MGEGGVEGGGVRSKNYKQEIANILDCHGYLLAIKADRDIANGHVGH